MTAPLIGLSPWILPLIAIAAKRKESPPRDAGLGRALLGWRRRKDEPARQDRKRPQGAPDARSGAHAASAVRPD